MFDSNSTERAHTVMVTRRKLLGQGAALVAAVAGLASVAPASPPSLPAQVAQLAKRRMGIRSHHSPEERIARLKVGCEGVTFETAPEPAVFRGKGRRKFVMAPEHASPFLVASLVGAAMRTPANTVIALERSTPESEFGKAFAREFLA